MKNTLGKSLVLLLTAVTIFSLRPTSLMADKPDTVVKPDKPPKEDKPPNPNKPPNPKKNTPPVADAGTDQNVLTSAIVTLDGSNSSDVDGQSLTYSWSFTSKPDGSNASLSSTTVEKPTFIPDINGTYIISLIVNDGMVNSSADSVTVTATNIAGILDPTFATDGISIHTEGSQGLDMIRDNSGNIYVTGYILTVSGSDMAIWKYTSDGSPDTTFGTNGFVTHNGAAGGTGDDRGNSIILDSEDNIYVAGRSSNTNMYNDMAIWKYTSSGVLDTTFGTNGYVTHSSAAGGNRQDGATGIVIDSEGSLYVSGYSENSDDGNYDYDMVIWKYTSDGSLDTTFDSDGIMVLKDITGYFQSRDILYGITIDSTDNIYVTGASSNYMVILKMSSNGNFDTTFHYDGIVSNYLSVNTTGSDILVNDEGSIFVTGYSGNFIEDNAGINIWKYTSQGNLDTSFSTDGIATYGAGGNGANDVAYGITLDSLGNVYVTGYHDGPYNYIYPEDMILLKYTSSGVLDTTFGTNGVVTHHNAAGGNGKDSGQAITIDSEGKIYVTGYSRSSYTGDNMVIWKYK